MGAEVDATSGMAPAPAPAPADNPGLSGGASRAMNMVNESGI